ncbi:MAG: TIGR04282 family arsenosugar biosynthesis glycosyltransferase [Thermoplasmata archaeon]|nr:MAG: TIGR04282 family arsenosugar biosynthesis glycosyltransferase [Thermoplasmata archaeon]
MDAVVIMAKEPKVGEVKTRLIPPLSPKTASELYFNFLLDKIHAVQSIKGIHPYLAYYPESGSKFFTGIVPTDFKLIKQEGKNLGERLANTSSVLIDSDFVKVLMIDSDTPNLPVSYIEHGLEVLNENDAVLGPCEDGGYYLIGIKSKSPGLFRDIPWSTPHVTKETLERADKLGLKITMLEKWYDVDTIEDLERLKRDLEDIKNNEADQFFCEHTKKFLNELSQTK